MKKTLTHEEISSLCYELSLLLHDDNDISPGEALSQLEEESDPAYRELLKGMREAVDGGSSLADAMEQAGCFPSYVYGLVRSGEDGKSTGKALSAVVRYYEDRARMNQRVRSALLYPAVMLALMLLVIGVLLVRVLPIFDDVYASLGGRLTGIAGGLLVMGRWLDRIMPVLWVLLAALAVFLGAFAAAPSFRERVVLSWRNRRGDKGISRQINSALVAKALEMGLESGMSLEEAVAQASDVVGDVPAAKERCLDCRKRLDDGAQPGEALRESGLLPARACRLLEMGSVQEEVVMAKIAEDLYQKSEDALEETVSRVEPALVMVCSVLVGLILLSVMLPLMHIMSAIG